MIINPLYFYFINLVDKLSNVFFCIMLFFVVMVFFIFWVMLDSYDEADIERCIKYIKRCLAIVFISVLILVIVPSKQTCIEMLVASQITTENINVGKEATKEAIDYIFEKIGEVTE